MTPEKELWACAVQIYKQHGDDAPRHIAERIEDLARQEDQLGVAIWLAIADRYDQLLVGEKPRH